MSLTHQLPDALLTREETFSAFVAGPLLHFWQCRQEGQFIGAGGVTLRFIHFKQHQDKPEKRPLIVLCSGRTESYLKYAEVAYDLVGQGFDVMVMDHRGQGFSQRLLNDPQPGHVEQFSDYIDDFETFIDQQVKPLGYQRHFAISHSMGGPILAGFLLRQPNFFLAVTQIAPMFGIKLPLPKKCVKAIVAFTHRFKGLKQRYVLGFGRWRNVPFLLNNLTHSKPRYQRMMKDFIDNPEIKLGGPTYSWLAQGIAIGETIVSNAHLITTPSLIISASEDALVDNKMHQIYCLNRQKKGVPCEGNTPLLINGARHEILIERDDIRVQALQKIMVFFARYNETSL